MFCVVSMNKVSYGVLGVIYVSIMIGLRARCGSLYLFLDKSVQSAQRLDVPFRPEEGLTWNSIEFMHLVC